MRPGGRASRGPLEKGGRFIDDGEAPAAATHRERDRKRAKAARQSRKRNR
jgi:hypothetical protein